MQVRQPTSSFPPSAAPALKAPRQQVDGVGQHRGQGHWERAVQLWRHLLHTQGRWSEQRIWNTQATLATAVQERRRAGYNSMAHQGTAPWRCYRGRPQQALAARGGPLGSPAAAVGPAGATASL